ncbi:MAG: pectinesterase family protein [Candidatus Cryptobacteroides sp.]
MGINRFASACLALLLLSVTVNAASSGNIVLRLMGDSTMADKDLSYGNPERGWGQRLKSRVDSCVTVANYAQNGRSTKSFITLGLWDKVKSELSEGDWLLIQFGHNDSKESDTTRYAAPYGAYSDNLRTFVSYALEVGAKPILLTPVSRRWFDDEGRLKTECHGDYPDAMKKVAEEFNIPLIDANAITQKWLIDLGDYASRQYYMWLDKGVCPKHPDGLVDNTHTNVAGARKLVDLLLPELLKVITPLEGHIINYDFAVAQDGSGDFFTIQEAVDAAPDYCKQAVTVIYVKKGVYEEKVTIPRNKEKLHIIGESLAETIVVYDDYALKLGSTGYPMGTSATSTVFIYAPDFLAENITFCNISGEGEGVGQACAVTVDADRVAFINCRFAANQDTIYTFGKWQRQYFKHCIIEGTTDFIFGASTVWFEDCDIISRKDSYVTAASTPEGAEFGYVFNNCRLRHAEGVTKVYLGRPWRPYAKTVFINCELGDHILKAGWHNWNKEYAEKTVLYAEYGSKGPGAATPTERVKWSKQLSKKEVARYVPSIVLDAGSEIDKNGNSVHTEWFFNNIF